VTIGGSFSVTPLQRAAQSGSGSGVVIGSVVVAVVVTFVVVFVVVEAAVVSDEVIEIVVVLIEIVVVVVVVVVVVEVNGVGCSPSQQVSSDTHLVGETQAFAEIQNKLPSTLQESGYPTFP